MGFWKSVGETALKIGKKAIDSTNAALKEAEKHKVEYRKYDDGKLKQILATGSIAKKMAATAILKERGYGKKD